MKKLLPLVFVLLVAMTVIACSSPAPSTTAAPATTAAPKPTTTTAAPATTAAPSTTAAPKPTTAAPSTTAAPKPTTAAPAAVINLTINSLFTPDRDPNEAMVRWAKAIVADSNGRIAYKFYDSGKLFAAGPAEKAISSGDIDVTMCAATTMVHAFRLPMLPILFAKPEDAMSVMESPEGFALLEKNAAKDNMKPMWFLNMAPIIGPLTNTPNPIKTLADVKGKRLRAADKTVIGVFLPLGASEVSITVGEVYTALQLKTIDGTISAIDSYVDRKWIEVGNSLTNLPNGLNVYSVQINAKKWASLPPDIQKIMLDDGKKEEAWMLQKYNEGTAKWYDAMKKAGVKITEPTEDLTKAVQNAAVTIYADFGKSDPESAALVKLALAKMGR